MKKVGIIRIKNTLKDNTFRAYDECHRSGWDCLASLGDPKGGRR